jgi:DNA-binding NarL/FixJ family response regulator
MQKTNGIASQISVLVAESCPMNCELMSSALERFKQRLTVVASATDSGEIQAAFEQHHPDVCIISAQLKDGPTAGFTALRELIGKFTEARAILLLDASERHAVVDAFRAGAQGVFTRAQPLEILCKSVHKVHEGQVWASNDQIRYLIDALAAPPPPITDAKGAPLLTKREQTLVQLVTEGRSNKDISRELNLSEHTVRNYLFRIFNKLGTSSRLELALYAINQRQAQRQSQPEVQRDSQPEPEPPERTNSKATAA